MEQNTLCLSQTIGAPQCRDNDGKGGFGTVFYDMAAILLTFGMPIFYIIRPDRGRGCEITDKITLIMFTFDNDEEIMVT